MVWTNGLDLITGMVVYSMSMTSADLKSLLTLVYKLVFLSVGLYMVLSGRLGVDVFDTLSKAVGGLLGP